jgi:hypothetical protein
MYSMGYLGLLLWGQVLDGRNLAESDWPPYARGSGGSPLMKKIDGSHHGVKVSERDRRMIMQWLDASAPYAGTYAALGCGFVGGTKSREPYNPVVGRAVNASAQKVAKKRCAACHATPGNLGNSAPIHFHNKADPRNRRSWRFGRHIIFNLSRPEKSLYLKAPLAKEAGGLGLCTNAVGKAVFASTDDPDYKAILAMIQDGKDVLEKVKRFDMQGFRPPKQYLREMMRYGVLPATFDLDNEPVDPYALDRRYWALDWTQLN